MLHLLFLRLRPNAAPLAVRRERPFRWAVPAAKALFQTSLSPLWMQVCLRRDAKWAPPPCVYIWGGARLGGCRLVAVRQQTAPVFHSGRTAVRSVSGPGAHVFDLGPDFWLAPTAPRALTILTTFQVPLCVQTLLDRRTGVPTRCGVATFTGTFGVVAARRPTAT